MRKIRLVSAMAAIGATGVVLAVAATGPGENGAQARRSPRDTAARPSRRHAGAARRPLPDARRSAPGRHASATTIMRPTQMAIRNYHFPVSVAPNSSFRRNFDGANEVLTARYRGANDARQTVHESSRTPAGVHSRGRCCEAGATRCALATRKKERNLHDRKVAVASRDYRSRRARPYHGSLGSQRSSCAPDPDPVGQNGLVAG